MAYSVINTFKTGGIFMQYIKKSMCLLLMFFIVAGSLLAGCHNNNSYERKELFAILKTFQNEDGGFSDPIININALYSTYHSMNILKSLDNTALDKDISIWLSTLTFDDIVKKEDYDNISEINFYIQLSNMLNYEIPPVLLNKLETYISNLQDKTNGFFYLSHLHKKEEITASNISALVLVATCNAIDIYDLLKQPLPYKDKLASYVREEIAALTYNNYYDVGLYSPLAKILTACTSSLSKAEQTIFYNVVTASLQELESNFDINVFFETLKIAEYADISLDKNIIKKYLGKIIGVDYEISYISDIVHYLNHYKLVDLLDKPTIQLYTNKIFTAKDWNNSINFLKNSSNIIATYFADKSLEHLKNNYYDEKVKLFLSTQLSNYEDYSILEKIFFLDLNAKYTVLESNIEHYLNKLFYEIINQEVIDIVSLFYLKEAYNAYGFTLNLDEFQADILNSLYWPPFITSYYSNYFFNNINSNPIFIDKNTFSHEIDNYYDLFFSYLILQEQIIAEKIVCDNTLKQDIASFAKENIDNLISKKSIPYSWYDIYNLIRLQSIISNK